MSELADEADSKSVGGNVVRVQVPPPALFMVISSWQFISNYDLAAMQGCFFVATRKMQHAIQSLIFFATTTYLPSFTWYEQVERVMSLSP